MNNSHLFAPSPAANRLGRGALFVMTFLYALSMTMIGPLMPYIIAAFSVRLSVAGLLVTVQQFGGALAIVAAALFADRAHKPLLIAAAFAAFSVSLAVASAAPWYLMLTGAFFFLGASSRLFDSVGNADVARWNPARSATLLSLLHTVFAVGALTGPIAVTALLESGFSWRVPVALLAATAGIAVLAYIWFNRPLRPAYPTADSVEVAGRTVGALAVLRALRTWVACAAMLAYVGHQAGFTVWLPMFLQTTLGASAGLAAAALSLYWAGIIVGRLIAAAIAGRVTIKTQLIVGGPAGAIMLLLAFASRDPRLFTAAAFAAGVTGGAVIPNLVTLVCAWFPANTATASSVLFLMATFGHMVFPFTVAAVSEAAGFAVGFLIPVLALGAVAIPALILPAARGDRAGGAV